MTQYDRQKLHIPGKLSKRGANVCVSHKMFALKFSVNEHVNSNTVNIWDIYSNYDFIAYWNFKKIVFHL